MENLPRYNPCRCEESNGIGAMFSNPDGEYVKFSDVKELLQTAHNNARDAIAFLQRAVDARIDDEWLKKVRAFLKQATAPVA